MSDYAGPRTPDGQVDMTKREGACLALDGTPLTENPNLFCEAHQSWRCGWGPVAPSGVNPRAPE